MMRRSFTSRAAGFCAVVGAVTALVLSGTPAQATLFDFSISGSHTGSGTLTTTDTSSPFTITGITGAFDGHTITGLDPGFLGADDVIFVPAPFLDFDGLSFFENGLKVNVFADAVPSGYSITAEDAGGTL